MRNKIIKTIISLLAGLSVLISCSFPAFAAITQTSFYKSYDSTTKKYAEIKNGTLTSVNNADSIYNGDDLIDSDYTYCINNTDSTIVSVKINGVETKGEPKVDKGKYSYFTEDSGEYYKLTDDMKNNIVATYSHCGIFRGEEVNIQIKLIDWQFLDNVNARCSLDKDGHSVVNATDAKNTSDDAKNVYVKFTGTIGISVRYCSWIKAQYSFVDNDGNPIDIKGYTTFNDVDGHQGIHFLDNDTKLYATNNSNLYYTNMDGYPYIFAHDDGVEDNEKKNWITAAITGPDFTVIDTFMSSDQDGTTATSSSGIYGITGCLLGGSGWISNYDDKTVAKAPVIETNYLDENGNPMCDSILDNTKLKGENYTTEQKTFDGYKLIEVPSNAKGIVLDETTTVNYIYQKICNVTGQIVIMENPDGSHDNNYGLKDVDIIIGNEIVATTDVNGNFTINNLSAGTHTATLSYKYGYDRNVTINTSDANSNITYSNPIAIVACNYNKDNTINIKDTKMFDLGVDNYDVVYDLNKDGTIDYTDMNIYDKFLRLGKLDSIYNNL